MALDTDFTVLTDRESLFLQKLVRKVKLRVALL